MQVGTVVTITATVVRRDGTRQELGTIVKKRWSGL
jgi:hypothetical protein